MADYKVVDSAQLDADLKVVADAIREKGGITEQLSFPHGMKQVVEAIQSGGGVGVDNTIYLTNLRNAYKSAVFPTGYELVLNLPQFETYMVDFLASATGIKSVKLVSNTINEVEMQSAFNSAMELELIDLSEFGADSKVRLKGSCFYVFRRCFALDEIKGNLDFTSCTSTLGVFQECNVLREVRFAFNSLSLSIDLKNSSKLSDDSIQSIIDGLATVETAQTLTLHADVKAKLTEEQISTITNKNWTLA